MCERKTHTERQKDTQKETERHRKIDRERERRGRAPVYMSEKNLGSLFLSSTVSSRDWTRRPVRNSQCMYSPRHHDSASCFISTCFLWLVT